MTKLFGTDGIRGTANKGAMTAPAVLRIAMAAAWHFRDQIYTNQRKPIVLIGKDTRLSGYMLEPALTAGFIGMGMDVVLTGPMPTPAIAMLTTSLRANLGVMLSASHNPYIDNGIKIFGPDGNKLSDEIQKEIEANFENGVESGLVAPELLGRAQRLDGVDGRYIEFAKKTFPDHLTLDGLKIVIDCAHGAAYKVAPTVLQELGAEVISIGVEPNGTNINNGCGATSTEWMRKTVVKEKAHLGIALDGDADRLIMADEKGRVIDGDQIMGLIAKFWQMSGRLQGDGIVATVMSNMGLEKYLTKQKIKLHRSQVGDRYVIQKMRETGCNVGGEQSGHMILADHSTTGDGLVSALQVLALAVESGKAMSEIANIFKPYPQVLKNIRFNPALDPLQDTTVKKALQTAQKDLGKKGRILVRKSGTEPLIRIMVEAEDAALMNKTAKSLETVVKKALS
ncbi:MAG: phosphoglucosamine mutase [Alphaproteobacteria bacterium]